MVVFFDLDGTIIDDSTQIIPSSAVSAIERLTANGHTAVVNTGRPYGHIDPRIYDMAFNAYVCACGMEVRLNGQRIHYVRPSDSMRKLARRCVEECGMEPIYEDDTPTVYMDSRRESHPYIQREKQHMVRKGCIVLDAAGLRDFPFQKFVTFDGPDCSRHEFIRRIESEFQVVVREGTLLEIITKGASKASGMQILLDAIGESRDHTLAIGDSNNDLPMFRFARHSVCMAHSAEEMKAGCEFVAPDVLEDGIEIALKHYNLI